MHLCRLEQLQLQQRQRCRHCQSVVAVMTQDNG